MARSFVPERYPRTLYAILMISSVGLTVYCARREMEWMMSKRTARAQYRRVPRIDWKCLSCSGVVLWSGGMTTA